MALELFKRLFDKSIGFKLSNNLKEDFDGYKIKGEIFWSMRDSISGFEQSGKLSNIVTLDASILIARLLKGTGTSVQHQTEPSFGIYALGVGTGSVSWDPLSPPSATNSQRSLYNELARKTIASTSFITSGGSISSVPTNIIDLTTTFSESEAVGVLTEMGLLGGDVNVNMASRSPILPPNGLYDATVNLVGKDTLVNYVTFPAITKPPTSTLSWTWRLTT